ncbi:hypothetical protein ACFE04_018730 [Oxalis oulophora]
MYSSNLLSFDGNQTISSLDNNNEDAAAMILERKSGHAFRFNELENQKDPFSAEFGVYRENIAKRRSTQAYEVQKQVHAKTICSMFDESTSCFPVTTEPVQEGLSDEEMRDVELVHLLLAATEKLFE